MSRHKAEKNKVDPELVTSSDGHPVEHVQAGVDHSNGQDGGEAIMHEEHAATAPAERSGADIIAELAESRLRIECEQARWDALADELGQRAKGQSVTRVPVRIGGTVYAFKASRESKTYSLIEARAPGEIK